MSGIIVLEQMVIIFALMLTGATLYRKKIISEASSNDMSALVVNVCNPALLVCSVFGDLSAVPKRSVLLLVGIGILCFFALILLGYLLVILLRVPPKLKSTYHLMTVFGNLGFIGIPVASAVLGPASLIYVAVFNFLFLVFIYSYGVFLLKKEESGKRETFGVKSLLNPGTVACLITIIIYWFDVPVPQTVQSYFQYIGNACTCLSMFVIGISLTKMKWKETVKNGRLFLFTAIRFIVIPILAALIIKPFISDAMIRGVIVLMMAVPAGNMPAMLAEQYGIDSKPLVQGIILTTILSVFTITLSLLFI